MEIQNKKQKSLKVFQPNNIKNIWNPKEGELLRKLT